MTITLFSHLGQIGTANSDTVDAVKNIDDDAANHLCL